LLGGDVCWTTGNETCTAGQCDWQRKCGPGQICEAVGSAAVCSTPISFAPIGITVGGTTTPSLFEFAAQVGSFEGLIVDIETHLACDGADDCLSNQICFKDCAFELKATTGSSYGGVGSATSIGGFSGPGANAACTQMGVCKP